MIRRIGTFLLSIGFDPRRLLAALRFLPAFTFGAVRFFGFKSSSVVEEKFVFSLVPTLSDRYLAAGTAKGHYFHQDLWVARQIFKELPKEHIDIGSRVDGFIAHLLTFMEVTILDIRDVQSPVAGLRFAQTDIMNSVGDVPQSSSVSCLHALEHFGLGRYGDPLMIDGWFLGLTNICGLVSPGGRLYLSVPVGNRQRIEFNAQRVFDPLTIPRNVVPFGFQLERSAFVDDNGDFIEDVDLTDMVCDFGLGCYVFVKEGVAH